MGLEMEDSGLPVFVPRIFMDLKKEESLSNLKSKYGFFLFFFLLFFGLFNESVASANTELSNNQVQQIEKTLAKALIWQWYWHDRYYGPSMDDAAKNHETFDVFLVPDINERNSMVHWLAFIDDLHCIFSISTKNLNVAFGGQYLSNDPGYYFDKKKSYGINGIAIQVKLYPGSLNLVDFKWDVASVGLAKKFLVHGELGSDIKKKELRRYGKNQKIIRVAITCPCSEYPWVYYYLDNLDEFCEVLFDPKTNKIVHEQFVDIGDKARLNLKFIGFLNEIKNKGKWFDLNGNDWVLEN